MQRPSPAFMRLIEEWHEPRYNWRGENMAHPHTTDSVAGLCEMWWDILSKTPWVATVVEVGCYRGKSTQVHSCFAQKVYAVDHWPEESILSVFLSRNLHNVEVMRMTSDAAASTFRDRTVDLVYIDANHAYESVKADIASWLPKVCKGGWLTGHDYDANCNGIVGGQG